MNGMTTISTQEIICNTFQLCRAFDHHRLFSWLFYYLMFV